MATYRIRIPVRVRVTTRTVRYRTITRVINGIVYRFRVPC